MGFSHSSIAVQGITRDQALEALGMTVSEIQTDILEGVSMFDWFDGWLIILSEDDGDGFDGQLEELGRLGQSAVAYGVNVDAGFSTAYGFEDGTEAWVVTTDPKRRNLRVVGSPPEQLDSIILAAKTEQENSEVDLFFDIPAKLMESICGYRIGKGDPDTIRYVNLKSTGDRKPEPGARTSYARPGFFARLFGRG